MWGQDQEGVPRVPPAAAVTASEAQGIDEDPWTRTLRHDLQTSSEPHGVGRKRGRAARADARPCAAGSAAACTVD